MSDKEEQLKLKSISDLLGKKFFIPSYQRGYKWDTRQVEDLLEDIANFAKNKKDNEFYCLQPVVVKKDDKNFRIIDGQQRLTTIYIILKYFNEVEFKKPKPLYSISFDTRPNSEIFLNSLNLDFITANIISVENIDFYYISNAFIEIDKWFNKNLNNNPDFIQEFYPILLNYIKVIWYEIKDENEIDVFTRLNIGKIPLTSAELIKALFLLKIKDSNEKLLLASQWDEIEYKLQNNTFFSFINSDAFNKPTRIEFIFDLLANDLDINIENLNKSDDKYSFYIFNSFIKDKNKAIELWDKVKTYFRVFEELYNDNTYYHLIGFLTHNKINIKELINLFTKNNKDEFLNILKNKIKNKINMDIEKLDYRKNYDDITMILFLFNVVSTMNSGYSRYPFNLHKEEKWSLEHIHAQNSEDITDSSDRITLLEDELSYVDDKIKIQIDEMLNKLRNKKKIANDDFDNLQNDIFEIYGDNIGLHTLDNLALLSRDDNSVLNNSIFPAKRDEIKKLDAKGSFIPIGTRNVFLKYYSNDVKEAVKWNNIDRKMYIEAIINTLEEYMGERND